ncbi:hypothetical protein EMGBS1_04830 [Chloroflexota bacterium]|nr:hypothetical protein EMGBS1_04830 [Chloroflexota bacterium]
MCRPGNAGASACCRGTRPEARQMEIFSWWTNGGEADGLNAMFEISARRIRELRL